MLLSDRDITAELESGRITMSGTGHELMESDSVKKAYLGG